MNRKLCVSILSARSTAALFILMLITAMAAMAQSSLQYQDLDNAGNAWTTCWDVGDPNCANDPNSGETAPHYLFQTGISAGGRDDVALYTMDVASDPLYANSGTYVWQEHRDSPPLGQVVDNAVYEFDLSIPTPASSIWVSQAIEFELQQDQDGQIYNMAWQFDCSRFDGTMILRIFDYYGSHTGGCTDCWYDSGITLQRFDFDAWYHVRAHFSISNGQVFHDWIEVALAGDPQPPRYSPTQNNIHQAYFDATAADTFNNALQLDLNANGDTYDVYFDNIDVGYNQPF